VESNSKELIVLVHGFGGKRAIKWLIASRLRSLGFRVQSWNHLSFLGSIDAHADRFFQFMNSQLAGERRFHIVAHSMGSIVARSALTRGEMPNLGRFVLLAPPNLGSPAARLASKILGNFIPPTCELSDANTSYVNQLGTPTGLEAGVIAAKYDILVPVRNTHLATEKCHIAIAATHNSLLLSRAVCANIASFINTGAFGNPSQQ